MTCAKRRFKDEIDAKIALARVSTSDRDKVPMRTYRCPRCKGWHLTSRA